MQESRSMEIRRRAPWGCGGGGGFRGIVELQKPEGEKRRSLYVFDILFFFIGRGDQPWGLSPVSTGFFYGPSSGTSGRTKTQQAAFHQATAGASLKKPKKGPFRSGSFGRTSFKPTLNCPLRIPRPNSGPTDLRQFCSAFDFEKKKQR